MCKDLFKYAQGVTDKYPVRVSPKCHPRAHLDVFVDGLKWVVTLSCSKCERPVAIIRVKRDNGRPKADS